jgi:hypothetical protein
MRKLLTRIAELRYHVLTDTWRVWPWDCIDPGDLTVPEANRVLSEHSDHVGDCVITRTALRVRQARIDAPTVRVRVFEEVL